MKLAKRTYSLPPDLLRKFEQLTPPGERSGFIARLIGERMAELERAELRRQIVEGCQEMSTLYSEIDAAWASASDEAWRERR